jgi:hypothetical protein
MRRYFFIAAAALAGVLTFAVVGGAPARAAPEAGSCT